jgi:hypothetical protein
MCSHDIAFGKILNCCVNAVAVWKAEGNKQEQLGFCIERLFFYFWEGIHERVLKAFSGAHHSPFLSTFDEIKKKSGMVRDTG